MNIDVWIREDNESKNIETLIKKIKTDINRERKRDTGNNYK